ncbi:methyltransferase domain-containing protein [Flavobacterium sp. MK4S-17]|uniref:methyltransferase domain-containing protein n=1 Tax=Flavobacterium sp. MK4S-17 TaxID=2543737 RepID=UPI001358975B|nr:methyltransferase domain-containing protein [Flavobacterium sp. MK4S-17]
MKTLNKNYWENRYKSNSTGWDVGYITPPLQQYIDQLADKNLKILIPGAGNGYEFEYLYNQGFKNSFVADIAGQPLENIKHRIPKIAKNHLIHGDFFEIEDKFDLVLEQTFFCALNPELRKKYAEKMYSILNPGAKLAGLFFQFPLTLDGPPFGGSREEYIEIFSPLFTIKTLETAYNSIKPREGRELFFIFEKK